MIEIINQQRKITINIKDFEVFTLSACKSISQSKNKSLSIAFISNSKIKELNKRFRDKNSVTDVLSFPNETDEFDIDQDYLGDIVISVQQAQKQAIENGLSLELEIKQLILHGILHLCGYDHETDSGEMNKLELKLRKKLNIY